jgi:hypothetical protein
MSGRAIGRNMNMIARLRRALKREQVKTRHDLFEELEACDMHWQTRFASLRDAAEKYGVLKLYNDFLRTPDGELYLEVANVNDVLSETHEAQAAADRLPYRLDNIGTVPSSEE